MKNKSVHYIVFFILSICLIIGIWLHSLLSPVVFQKNGYVFDLPQGASRNKVIALLSEQGIIRYPRFFLLYVYPQHAQVKSGEYLFPQGSTLVSIWRQITEGKGHYLHAFTIVPGWTFSQLRAGLLHAQGLNPVTASLTDQQIMQRLRAFTLKPEGEFFPETYYYTKGNPDLIILKRAYDFMQTKLTQAWRQRTPGLPYQNAYEALIAASLIERESYLSAERPRIAGVLVNRLRKDMLLQFDPTVIYGLGDNYHGKIYKTDLHQESAYNTYIHKGLPPTPIAMPSMSAIDAALHPEVHDFYYFVAKGDGSHQFSKTLLEHNNAVKQLINWQNEHLNESYIRKEALIPPVIH